MGSVNVCLSHLFLEKNFSKIEKVLIPKKNFSKNENYCVPLGHTLVKSYIYIYIAFLSVITLGVA